MAALTAPQVQKSPRHSLGTPPGALPAVGGVDLAHMDAEVVRAAAAAGVAKAAAAAAKPSKPNHKCPCPNCRAATAATGPPRGSGAYGQSMASGNSQTGAQLQQQGGAAKGAGSKEAQHKNTPTLSLAALPTKPLMSAATTKDIQGPRVRCIRPVPGMPAWPRPANEMQLCWRILSFKESLPFGLPQA
jgi:hypothetical protein